MEQTKKCTKCGKVKPLSKFGKHCRMKDGHTYRCKECISKYGKWYRYTPSGVYQAIKGRNKFYQGKPFEITREEFVEWYNSQPKICVYCDLLESDLPYIDDSYNNKSLRMSIDAKNNDLGYIKGNIAICCHRCNSIKSDLLSFDEMREFAQKYIKSKWEAQLRRAI